MSEFAFASPTATPRKRPLQQRSQQTVAAILEATFQVLAIDGAALTTTRVAERAGVSVGTLYQYFPNREALLTAAFADHLEAAIDTVEQTAERARGLPVAEAAGMIVRELVAAKRARANDSLLLHQVFRIGMLDERPLVAASMRRAHVAIARTLWGGAPGEPDEETRLRAAVACDAVQGAIASAIHEAPARLGDPVWIDALVAVAVAGASGTGGSAKIPSV